jgi:integrase/recombinase XerD
MTPLRQRMLEDMSVRNLAENTQSAYLQQVAAYSRYFGRSPDQLGPEEIRTYQLYLMEVRALTPSSICVATGALRFLYKITLKRTWAVEEIPMPKRPRKLPEILSPEEVRHFLDAIINHKHRAILMTAYAAGLRVSEATHLKVTDIDSQRMMLRVEQGKGMKDRYVMLSPRLLDVLRTYWKSARPTQWMFPGEVPGQPITREAVGLACQKARRDAGITKLWGVHLTGVGDLPPRATRRGSLHTGRMSSLVRRHGRNRLWAPVYNKVLVAHRPMGDSKLEDPVEQHPAAT